MVNVRKLRGKIVENGLTVELLADAVGINRSTFYRRLAENGEPFTIKESDSIVDALHLTADEAMDIFFSQYVA